MSSNTRPAKRSDTLQSVFSSILRWGTVLAVAIAVLGGALGFWLDGTRGLVSVLIGAGMALFFLAASAGSILIVNRYSGRDYFSLLFFGVVLGAWLVKFVIFIVLVVLLRDQPWINVVALFSSLVAGAVGSVVVDAVVVLRSRIPIIALTPAQPEHPTPGTPSSHQ
jgi:drug/metabolite transporter (DMT)-like permease